MKFSLTLFVCLLALGAAAQPGISEMQQARDELAADYFSAFDLSLVLATILGLTGAVKIYHNWQMGKHHIDADIAAWFYAAFFMLLAGAFLSALFGI
ncbi:DUF4134 domain-containing protein [Mucilaginibacter sp. UR6-1]|uniref:DUF4134 family protein n=1 Tax=Mucilaginibacter sp. UR6-1 TaxID=1435643 RepID=UPI001E63FD69|nr:DUF4134 family protein [Mucilaginibacter sp. UR6-1]MCC8407715.1 DUF4134 domain-containing protein [Mucilaginibacter sp. UR6-1]